MAARHDKRDGDGAAVVQLVDVRRGRAKRVATPMAADDGHADAAALEDAYDYTADMVSTAELPDERGLSVDETLSRHESAVTSSPSTAPDQSDGVDGGELVAAAREGTADEILEAISAQYPRSLSPASSAPPRGSVDLDRDAPRQRRPRFGSRRMFRTRVRARAALLTAIVVVSAIVIAAIAFAGAHPRATLDAASHDHPSAKPTVVTVAGKVDVGTHAPLRPVSGGRQHHTSAASSRRHSKASKTRTARRSRTGSSNVTASYTAASAPSTLPTGGSSQPSGPIGAGGTVGTNCNPKCQ